jgi:hypothetical protein
LGGLAVDPEVEGHRLLDGQVGRLVLLANLIRVIGVAPNPGGQARS